MAADSEVPASKASVHGRRDELTPVESDPDAHLTLWQAIKKWRRVVLYCVGLTSGILMFGYDYVIVGTTSAMPSFQCGPSHASPPAHAHLVAERTLASASPGDGSSLRFGWASGPSPAPPSPS